MRNKKFNTWFHLVMITPHIHFIFLFTKIKKQKSLESHSLQLYSLNAREQMFRDRRSLCTYVWGTSTYVIKSIHELYYIANSSFFAAWWRPAYLKNQFKALKMLYIHTMKYEAISKDRNNERRLSIISWIERYYHPLNYILVCIAPEILKYQSVFL